MEEDVVVVEELIYVLISASVSALLISISLAVFPIENIWKVTEGAWKDVEEMVEEIVEFIKSL